MANVVDVLTFFGSDGRFLERDPEQLSRHPTFLKFTNVQQIVPLRYPFNFRPVEEVHDEAANFVHLFAPMDAGSKMRITCVTNGEDVQATRLQNSMDFLRETFDFRIRDRHTVQHVGVGRIEAVVSERERCPDIVANGCHEFAQP